jgi:hypothetical protein
MFLFLLLQSNVSFYFLFDNLINLFMSFGITTSNYYRRFHFIQPKIHVLFDRGKIPQLKTNVSASCMYRNRSDIDTLYAKTIVTL